MWENEWYVKAHKWKKQIEWDENKREREREWEDAKDKDAAISFHKRENLWI